MLVQDDGDLGNTESSRGNWGQQGHGGDIVGGAPTCHHSLSPQGWQLQPWTLMHQQKRRCQVSRGSPEVPTPPPHHAGGLPQPPGCLLGWGAEVSVGSCWAAGCPRPAARSPP